MSAAATGLDFASIVAVASVQGVDLELLTDALPELETVMLAGMAGDVTEEE